MGESINLSSPEKVCGGGREAGEKKLRNSREKEEK